jgi:hypothetical protein
MKIFKYVSLIWILGGLSGATAQDCTLGLGGKDSDLIIQVFDLDSTQQAGLRTLAIALKAENDHLEEKAQTLLDTHPQNSEEALASLGSQYQTIKDQMVENAARYDRLLLGLFNPDQYALYRELCLEVVREPLTPILAEDTPAQPQD